MDNLDQTYLDSLQPLYTQIHTFSCKNPVNIPLIEDLIHSAIAYDKTLIKGVTSTLYNSRIQRDFNNPPDYTSTFVLGQTWSDHPQKPLRDAEQWNKGRRGCNTGIRYNLDDQNYPINPYYNYGIKGRGMIGMYGPNHAVDIGILRIQKNAKGQPALHALGIVRNDNGLPALCGGFTQFIGYSNGNYPYTQQVKIMSQSREFFEEMISGSVTLMDKYSEELEEDIAFHVESREKIQGPLSQKERDTIHAELTTARKVKQVNIEDPLFISRIHHTFREAVPCYEGPVLSSSRNTNTSWMETKLSYFVMDDQKWEEIKGDNKFRYELAAGDDASNVLWHEITPQLIEKAGSHSAFFAYLLSGFLLTNPPSDLTTLAAIQNQARELADCLKKKAALPSSPVYSV